MTVQDIINGASQDIRSQLATSGTEANILIDYVNRVHLDLLRFTHWQFLISGVKTFSTTADEDQYFIGSGSPPAGATDVNLDITDLGAIKKSSVFDRTNHRPLFKTDEKPLISAFEESGYPQVWRNDGVTPYVLELYPAPQGVYSIEFRYYKTKPQLTAVGDALLIPADYKDVVIAGVNELASAFIKDPAAVMYWNAIYREGKRAMIRDANLLPRGPEFIAPDRAATPRNVSYAYDYFDDLWNRS